MPLCIVVVDVVDDPKCNCGDENQDLNHILWQCPLLEEHRPKLLEKLISCKLYPPFDIKMFIIEPNIQAMTYVYNFLDKNNLKI